MLPIFSHVLWSRSGFTAGQGAEWLLPQLSEEYGISVEELTIWCDAIEGSERGKQAIHEHVAKLERKQTVD